MTKRTELAAIWPPTPVSREAGQIGKAFDRKAGKESNREQKAIEPRPSAHRTSHHHDLTNGNPG
jgi:hypothetical protein